MATYQMICMMLLKLNDRLRLPVSDEENDEFDDYFTSEENESVVSIDYGYCYNNTVPTVGPCKNARRHDFNGTTNNNASPVAKDSSVDQGSRKAESLAYCISADNVNQYCSNDAFQDAGDIRDDVSKSNYIILSVTIEDISHPDTIVVDAIQGNHANSVPFSSTSVAAKEKHTSSPVEVNRAVTAQRNDNVQGDAVQNVYAKTEELARML